MHSRSFLTYLLITVFMLFSPCYYAETLKTVDLHIAYKQVHFAGRSARAIAVNDQIPGPTLHFTEGDHVRIRVFNHIDQGTAIHWHGLLVPWKMDGVEHVTQAPIPPGGMFQYEYQLKQSGTYWYHAHSGLQEQQGVYGAYIIDPKKATYTPTKEFVMVLSDWSNTSPNRIYAHLKARGDYYSLYARKQPSLWRYLSATPAERKIVRADYVMMYAMRMNPYDLSDVVYDAYLLNGHTRHDPWKGIVKKGDVVRLRFIDAGGSTLYRISIPNREMQLIHVQGNDVTPRVVNELTMAPGETADVLLHIKDNEPTLIYAESNDQLGKVYGALVTAADQSVDFSSLTPLSSKAMTMTSHTMHHDHGDMQMPSSEVAPAATKYQLLVSPVKTNMVKEPDETIRITLSGYMDRYMWFLNGVPEYRAKPILIEPGKRYRVIFVNETMMNHPMHLHGHWFILRNGHGQYDPKLHTIDVAPFTTVTADFDANEEKGFWYFHCHNLFHMQAGMANLMYYPDTKPLHSADGKMPTAHPARMMLANEWQIGVNPTNNTWRATLKTMWGMDYYKLQLFMNDAEIIEGTASNIDMDVFYWQLIDQFWAIKGGVNYVYRPGEKPYWQPGVGLEGLMPYFIETNVRAYKHLDAFKIDVELSRDNQLTDNGFLRMSVRGIAASTTIAQDDIGSGVNKSFVTLMPYYRVWPGTTLFVAYEYERTYGALRDVLQQAGESATDHTLTAGMSWVF